MAARTRVQISASSPASAGVRLDAAAAVTALMSSSDTRETALGVIIEQARDVIGATLAIGSLVAHDGHGTFVSAVSGSGARAPLDAACLSDLAAKIDRPVRVTRARAGRHPLAREARALLGARLRSCAWLAAPLVGRDGATIGVLQVFGHRRAMFRPADEARLTHLALIMSLALEHFRTRAEAERRRREGEDLARAARTLTESLDVHVVARRTVEIVLSLFDVAGATLRRLAPDGSLVMLASAGPVGQNFPPGHVLPAGVGVSARAILEGRPVQVIDAGHDPRIVLSEELRSGNEASNVRGTVAVPLLVQGKTIGALAAIDDKPRVFADAEVALLEAFAAQVALALENAKLYADVKNARDFLESITTNSADAIVTTDGQGRLTFFSPGSEHMLGYRADEVLGRPTADFVRTGLDETRSFMRRLVQEQQINDYETVMRAKDGRWVETSNTFSLLRDEKGAVIGTVGVIRDITERKRAEAAAERRRQMTVTLADLGRLVTRSLDPGEVATRIVESARTLLDTAGCGVYRRDGTTGDLHPLAFSAAADHTIGPDFVVPNGLGAVGLAVQLRTLVATTDAIRDHRLRFAVELRQRLEATPYGSVLAVPLVAHDDVIGMIAFVNQTGRAWTEEETRLATSFGDFALIALENARLYKEAQRRRRAAETLAELGNLVTRSLNLDEVATRIVESAGTLLGAAVCALYLPEPATGDLHALAYHGASDHSFDRGAVIGKGVGLIGLAVEECTAVASPDVLADPRVRLSADFKSRAERTPYRAGLAVPLIAHDRAIGTVGVVDRTGRVFTAEEIRLAGVFADFAVVAIENARLYAESDRRRQEAETFADLAARISSSLELDTILERIASAARELCAADRGSVALRDAATGTMRFQYWSGDNIPRGGDPIVEAGHGQGGVVMVTGRLSRTDDYANDPAISEHYHDWARANEIVAQVVVPIRIADRVEGLMYVANKSRRPFTDHDEAILVRLADHAAIALRNASLFVDEQMARASAETRAQQQIAIADLGQRALAGADIATLMDAAAALVATPLGVDYTRILELAPDGQSLVMRAGIGWNDAAVGRTISSLPDHSQVGHTVRSRMPVVVENFETDPRFRPSAFLRSHGIVSGITVVMHGPSRPFGVMGAHATSRRLFADDDVNFMQAVANVLALAIERRRVEEALEQSNERLRILNDIEQGIALAESPSAIAQVALTHIRRLVPCRTASIALFHAESGEAILLAGTGDAGNVLDGRRSLADFGSLDALRAGREHLVAHVTAAAETSEVLQALAREGVQSIVDVPLVYQDDLIGVLTMASDRLDGFSPTHLDIAREVAKPLAIAIDQARLRERVWIGRERLRLLSRRLVDVQESERRHLSRELHDEIGQILTGLKFTLDATSGSPDPSIRPDLARAREMVAGLMERVRTLSLDLRPGMLDDLGLLPTFAWHFERYGAEAKIDIDFKHRGIDGRRFPTHIETAAYRIVQEALTNVARHAGTASAMVRVWADDLMLGVQIEDRGAGFEPPGTFSATHGGLTGMRERALLLGGRFEIESSPEHGTRITAELPLNEPLERRQVAR